MFRFLPGIIVIQALTAAFILLLPEKLDSAWLWLQMLFPIVAIGLLASFWFDSIATQLNRDKVTELQNQFIAEREKIRVNAERSKVRLLKQNHKQVVEETRNVNAKANFKVGAVSTAAVGVGVFLMTTQLVAMGMMVLMTTGGVLTGYAIRARQEKTGRLPFSQMKLPFKKPTMVTIEKSAKQIEKKNK